MTTHNRILSPEDSIKAQAIVLGFADCGIVNIPESWEAKKRLEAFVEAGFHGQMSWMLEGLGRRSHPNNMWHEAKSAIVLGYNYGPELDPLEGLKVKNRANISVYARGDDYHDIIKKKLKILAGWIARNHGCEVKVFVDTAPLMEKPLAQLSGLGWQGKHTNLVSNQYGSWLFLGVVLTDRLWQSDVESADHCGSCRACLDICPTGAFLGPYQLDARACLSYLTIEHKGAWPLEYRSKMGNRIYGCDDCLAVCPWNKFALTAGDIKLKSRDGFDELNLLEMAQFDGEHFRQFFTKSPIKRIGLTSFLRNVNYALGNYLSFIADSEARQATIGVLVKSLENPESIVRGSAVWALKNGLEKEDFFQLKARFLDKESDIIVQEEWGDYE